MLIAGAIVLAWACWAAALGIAADADPHVEFRSTWGGQGSAPGEFQGPFGVAVDKDGFVFVTDSGNRRVQKFAPDGGFIREWTGGESEGFGKPTGIAVAPDGTVYVSDYFADRIHRFTPDGELLQTWGASGSGPGELDSPAGLAVGTDGSVYVVDEYNFRVQRFTGRGRFLGQWGSKAKVNAILSALNFLLPDGLEGKFYYPARIAAGADDLVYVSDSYNNRVQVFTAEGTLLRTWGGLGLWGGRFRVTSDIAVDRDNRVYVADFYNNRVQAFDSEGNYLGRWGESGNGRGEFDGPTGLAVRRGVVYVADFHNHRIQKFLLSK